MLVSLSAEDRFGIAILFGYRHSFDSSLGLLVTIQVGGRRRTCDELVHYVDIENGASLGLRPVQEYGAL